MMKLFTVGPVPCYPEVLKAMGMQMMSHRSKEYIDVHYDTVEKLQEFIETKNRIFLFSSTGTGFMEAAVRNCVSNKMLVCVNGSFGERFASVAEANGKKVIKLVTKLGEPVRKEMLEIALESDPDIEAVAFTHNETSVGLINDLSTLTRLAKDYGKLVFVDAVSSMGGTDIKADEWGIDMCLSSSQKCFGVPPGIGVGSVSEEALDTASKMNNKGWYFDMSIWKRYHDQHRGTPMTSCIPQIFSLNTVLRMIEEKGGKHWYFKLYEKRNQMIRNGIQKLGLNTFPMKGFESPTVSCINAPEGMSGPDVYHAMRDKGFELAQGYGATKETTFRIGNMGWIPEETIKEMLESLAEIL